MWNKIYGLSGIKIDITEGLVAVTKINHTLNPNHMFVALQALS